MSNHFVNKAIRKKDAMALVTGKPVYTDDIAPKDCLIVKVLRSPYAHALIEEIQTANALKQKGIECRGSPVFLPIKIHRANDLPWQVRHFRSQARMTG